MASNKVYWKSFDQLANTEVSQRLAENEFAQDIPADVFLADERSMEAQASRRDFLKFLGFSTAAWAQQPTFVCSCAHASASEGRVPAVIH